MGDDYRTRTPAQTAWLLAAGALVVTMLAGGGYLALSGLLADQRPTTGAPDAPAGPEQVAFGAPELIDGVPWGFAVSADGAVAAAVTAVAVTGQAEVVFDAARFEEVAEVVFTPAEATAQARQVEAARTEFELSGWAQQPASRRMYHLAPLAVRLETFDPDGSTAQVEVWAMTLVGVGDAGGAMFTTSTVELTVPEDGETWQVADLESVEGPTPLVAETATAPGRTRAWLRDATATLPLPLPEPGGVAP